MKATFVLVLTAAAAFAQQGFDIKSLDRLGANAKSSTNVTLEGDTLKLAQAFLGKGKDDSAIKDLVNGLRGIYVRSFEFEEAGKYSPADVEPLRAWLAGQKWSRLVDVKDKNETTQVWLQTGGGKTGGLAVIATEPKEVTVVYIDGTLTVDDLAKLGGNLGIPDMTFRNDGKKPAAAAGGGKKEE